MINRDQWWGFSLKHGFVMLDRTKSINRSNSSSNMFEFTKCSNWSNYKDERRKWNSIKYYVSIEATNLSKREKEKARKKIEFYQSEYDRKTKDEVKDGFLNNNIDSLWHLTHVKNINSIVKHGIYNHYKAHKNIGKSLTDISDNEVQRWRDSKELFYKRRVHEYVPLYINYDNLMVYKLKRYEYQQQLCLIEVSLDVLSENDFLFTDRNAACYDAVFYKSSEDLKKLPWAVLQDDTWDWNDSNKLSKQQRQAEVLIYPEVHPKFIEKIYCSSKEMYRDLSEKYKDLISNKNIFD